ncbi:nitrate/nitrite sensor protein NarX [[Pantoea] beijingensis]|uniref:Sensor protein n=1 Tax=[Pantoea] beijingensis TaxID=1324864 RepID=A0A443IBI7_9GAMM|nr:MULTISPECIES: nitrate/nitrite two-component system sensor histidine kinase NarX [Erwiniaceae]RWR01621.1 nitrate/nitrite sensor protein NarX [[Pantoea] beijingensis]
MTRLLAPLSLVNQLACALLMLGSLGIGGMSISAWMAQSIQGNAHAINVAGSLRMQSYRLLAQVPLNSSHEDLIRKLDSDVHNARLQKTVSQGSLTLQLKVLQDEWQQNLQPMLRRAQSPVQAADEVASFVTMLDTLVAQVDRQTENRLFRMSLVQGSFIFLIICLLISTFIWFRRRLLQPWRQLIRLAHAVGHGDFSQRFVTNRRLDEMSVLGEALNSMSGELSVMYAGLEKRVKEKTADLERKNQVLHFLYHSSQQLHTGDPIEQRLTPLLNELQNLLPLRAIDVRLYENNLEQQFLQLSGQAEITESEETDITPYPVTQDRIAEDMPASISLPLSDKLGNYGVLLAQPVRQLKEEHYQLLRMLVEQLTSMLALEQQVDHQQQLMLMEERAAIARELHDSIAQSLSCLKIQVSCLQMQKINLPPQSLELINQMREELNVAYRQLRELLTTFRLRLTEPGLLPALQSTTQEFSLRLGVNVELEYQLNPRTVAPWQAIHLLQIAREALSNIHKHANASQVHIQVTAYQGEVTLSVTDNGRGLPDNAERPDHYGLIIMRDRARSLHGRCDILPRENGGTEVRVTFRPANQDID